MLKTNAALPFTAATPKFKNKKNSLVKQKIALFRQKCAFFCHFQPQIAFFFTYSQKKSAQPQDFLGLDTGIRPQGISFGLQILQIFFYLPIHLPAAVSDCRHNIQTGVFHSLIQTISSVQRTKQIQPVMNDIERNIFRRPDIFHNLVIFQTEIMRRIINV